MYEGKKKHDTTTKYYRKCKKMVTGISRRTTVKCHKSQISRNIFLKSYTKRHSSIQLEVSRSLSIDQIEGQFLGQHYCVASASASILMLLQVFKAALRFFFRSDGLEGGAELHAQCLWSEEENLSLLSLAHVGINGYSEVTE